MSCSISTLLKRVGKRNRHAPKLIERLKWVRTRTVQA